jgi:hypothetical protein
MKRGSWKRWLTVDPNAEQLHRGPAKRLNFEGMPLQGKHTCETNYRFRKRLVRLIRAAMMAGHGLLSVAGLNKLLRVVCLEQDPGRKLTEKENYRDRPPQTLVSHA